MNKPRRYFDKYLKIITAYTPPPTNQIDPNAGNDAGYKVTRKLM